MKRIMVRGGVKGRPLHKVIEFCFVGSGRNAYLRIGVPVRGPEEYVGAVDGEAAIRKLRDYLTASLRRRQP